MSPSIYFLRRMFAIVPTFIGITLVSFFIIHLAPGGPVEQALKEIRFGAMENSAGAGKSSDQIGVTEEVKAALQKQFGFDKPVHLRYLLWLKQIVSLDLGRSFIIDEDVPVIQLIVEKFPISLRFGIFSFLITYLICVPLGIVKALKDGSRFDIWSSVLVFAGYAMPSILLAILLIVLFGGGTFWNLLPISGLRSEGWEELTRLEQIWDEIKHMIMPMTCYVMGNFATLTILMKNSILEEIRKEYVLCAFAKGLSARVVYFKHVLRNALIPIATGFAGILGVFLSGSLLLEQIFSLDGIGRLGYTAVVARDYPVVLGLLVIGSMVLLVSRILTDLIYVLVDPRIDYQDKSSQPLGVGQTRWGSVLLSLKDGWSRSSRATIRLLRSLPKKILSLKFKVSFHPSTQRRIRRFRDRKLAWYSLWFILITFVFSLAAELWISDDPLLLKYQGQIYSPILKRYQSEDFGITDSYVIDYHQLSKDDSKVERIIFAYPYGPLTTHKSLQPPSREHWLGTDQLGRDLWARLVYGYRISMFYALAVWACSFFAGTIIGGLQGYYGGKVDFLTQRFTEIWSAMPGMYLLIILIAIFGQSLSLLVFLTVLFDWVFISYYMRAEFLRMRGQPFVLAALSYGASHLNIMFRHILPNGLTPLITFTPFTIASGITGIAVLDYLGLGLQPPTPSWGELMKQAMDNFTIAWWIPASIISAFFFTLLALVFINEGVRDAFDPKK